MKEMAVSNSPGDSVYKQAGNLLRYLENILQSRLGIVWLTEK